MRLGAHGGGMRARGAPVRHPALFVASECPATQEREAYDRLLVFHRDINRSVTRDHSHRIHGRRDVVKNGKARLLAHGKLGIAVPAPARPRNDLRERLTDMAAPIQAWWNWRKGSTEAVARLYHGRDNGRPR